MNSAFIDAKNGGPKDIMQGHHQLDAGGWGDNISLFYPDEFGDVDLNTETVKVVGHKPTMPRVGEIVIGEFDQSFIQFEIVSVDPCDNPVDMFFAQMRATKQVNKKTGRVCLSGPEKLPKHHYKDFDTGKPRWTRGKFLRWGRGGLLNAWYAVFVLPRSGFLYIPDYCLRADTKAALPPIPKVDSEKEIT